MTRQPSHARGIAVVLVLLFFLGGVITFVSNHHHHFDTSSQASTLDHNSDTTELVEPQVITNLTHNFLSRRQGQNSREYNLAKDKGRRYICMLAADSVPDDQKTKWIGDAGYKALTDQGWDRVKTSEDKKKLALDSIQDMLKARGLATEGGAMQDVHWEHSKEWRKDGKGMLAVQKGVPVSNVPDLKQWSDVVFLELAHMATPDQLRKLKYIVRFNIVDASPTTKVLSEALGKSGLDTLPIWPGVTFKKSDLADKSSNNAFDAVMGTPHLTAVAWLLLQHREQLGKKTVGSILAWNADRKPGSDKDAWKGKACLLVELVDVKRPGRRARRRDAGGVEMC